MLNFDEQIKTRNREVQGGRPLRIYKNALRSRTKKNAPTPSKAASDTQQSCLLPKIDLAADVFNLTLDLSKIEPHQKKKVRKKQQNFPSPNMQIPVQYRAKRAAVGAWVLLEPDKEEQTEGAVGGGGQNS